MDHSKRDFRITRELVSHEIEIEKTHGVVANERTTRWDPRDPYALYITAKHFYARWRIPLQQGECTFKAPANEGRLILFGHQCAHIKATKGHASPKPKRERMELRTASLSHSRTPIQCEGTFHRDRANAGLLFGGQLTLGFAETDRVR
jgi:hypothetical protein